MWNAVGFGSPDLQIFGCNFIFRSRALGAWCVISLHGSILLIFHLGNPVTDVIDIWCGMSTLKVVRLILFRPLQYEYFIFESGLLNMDYIYIHPRRYIVCGSEKGDVSLYDVSQDRFSHKRNVKVGRMVQENLLSPRQKRYLYLPKFTENMSKTTIRGGGSPS
jgi:hypothetical protein